MNKRFFKTRPQWKAKVDHYEELTRRRFHSNIVDMVTCNLTHCITHFTSNVFVGQKVPLMLYPSYSSSYPVLPQATDWREWEEEEGEEESALRISSDEEEDEMMPADPTLDSQLPMLVLPLYSLLSPQQQAKVCVCLSVCPFVNLLSLHQQAKVCVCLFVCPFVHLLSP